MPESLDVLISKISELKKIRNSKMKLLQEYTESLGYTRELVDNLKTSENELGHTQDDIKVCFSLGPQSVHKGRMDKMHEEMGVMISRLNDSMIGINDEIKRLNSDIKIIDTKISNLEKQKMMVQ